MKRVLILLLILCNNININAGLGWSKSDGNSTNGANNTGQDVDGSGFEPEIDSNIQAGLGELTNDERALLATVLSNKKVLSSAAKIAANKLAEFHGSNNIARNNVGTGLVANNVGGAASAVPLNLAGPVPNSSQTPHFTINVNSSHNLNNTSQSQSNAANSNEIHITLVQQLYNLLKEYSNSTGNFLYRHRYKIIIVAIIIIVAVLFYKLVILKSALASSQCLTNCWQSGKALADIFSTSTPELTKDLLQTICTKFAGPEAYENCSIALTKFMQQAAAEKAAIIAYTKICAALAFLRISFMFPVDNQIVESSKERLNKLSYMEKLVNEFMAKSCAERMARNNFA